MLDWARSQIASWSARTKTYLRNLYLTNYQLRKGAWPRKSTSCNHMPVAFYAAWLPRSFTLSTLRSFNHFFELSVEHLNVGGRATAGGRVEAIDGNVKPVSFFAFHDEVTKTLGIGFVMPGLGDHID